MKRFIIIITTIILPISSWAQHFSNKAKVNPVTVNAFYKIKINADVVAYCNNQLQDLRLFDNDGTEIPYLLNKEHLYEQHTTFNTYSYNQTREGNKDIIIVENKNRDSIGQFLFEMKNADASRLIRISGSDNKDNWFVVRDSFYFESYGDNNNTTVRKSLQFPKTDYGFYKIEIRNNNNESPLNIIRIGNNDNATIPAVFQRVNGLSYTVSDSNKSTFIHFKIKPGNKIDRLAFTIDAPEMFLRNVIIKKFIAADYYSDYSGSSSGLKKKARAYNPVTMEAELSSNYVNNIDCSNFLGNEKCDSFIIQIVNKDDAPLHFKSIEAYQLGTTITAKLDKDKAYFLYFGDSLLTPPSYDLVYFNKNIPSDIKSIDVQNVQSKQQEDKDEYNGNKDKMIVWIGLGLAGITILLLTMNMMKKMNNSQS
ncbi:hypothetical protein F0919_02705 [Taibaiella lutea]|uniref:DUF3999 domain-containing protein n=1 Tax=Taibaiella lutea TaxID=2608001 RepID=A0A5M6CMZ9_9BACT|nr:hypothetical protein [Taibaiella lutea]KAA5536598.1 hypothetical protein F0919_02705 [Taibaiella lutea]